MTFWSRILCGVSVGSTLAVVGCGGGGAASGLPSGGSPGPSPSPVPSPSPATVSGTVTDFDSNAPVSGATVKIGSLAPVRTNGSGQYTVSGIPGGSVLQYIQVTDGASYATYNSGVLVSPGATTTRNLKLMNPSTNCSGCVAWLAQVNTDRANNGAGAVAFDEAAMEAARTHAVDMATQKYHGHNDTNGTGWYARYAQLGGVGLDNENWGYAYATWQACETAFMAEGPGGPHHDNIVDPRHQWVGMFISNDGTSNYYDQEFVDLYSVFDPSEVGNSVTSGTQVSVHVLSLGSSALYFQIGSLPLPTPLTPSQINGCSDGICEAVFPSTFSSISGAGVPGVPNLYKETATLSPSGQYFLLSASGTHFLGVTWIEAH